MTDTPFNAKNGIVANGGFTANSTLVNIGSVSLNTSAVIVGSNYTNSTYFTGTSNNSTYFNGQPASYYQTNVATLTSNNTSYVGSISAANVVSNAQLQANLSNLTSNNTSFVGSISAANVVSNAQLQANLSNYVPLTSNNTSYVGSISAANVVSNAQLQANLSNYARLSGATFTGGVTAAYLSFTSSGGDQLLYDSGSGAATIRTGTGGSDSYFTFYANGTLGLINGGLKFTDGTIQISAAIYPPYLTEGSLGTYVLAYYFNTTPLRLGNLVAGSSIQPSSADSSYVGSPLSGVWKCLGMCPQFGVTLFYRVG